LQEARNDLAAWLTKWSSRYPKLCDWGEANIELTLTFYGLPQPHHKHLKSTNLLECLNEELENWIEATRYLNMELLSEQKKEQLRQIHTAA
jgi:transposase-like protein